jgi:hypothetical protein
MYYLEGGATDFGPIYLSAASHAIAKLWYQKAQDREWKSVMTKMIGMILMVSAACPHVLLITTCSSPVLSLFYVSLGTGKEHWSRQKVTLNAALKAMLIKWSRMARSKIQKRSGDARNASRGQKKNIEAVRSKKEITGKENALR